MKLFFNTRYKGFKGDQGRNWAILRGGRGIFIIEGMR